MSGVKKVPNYLKISVSLMFGIFIVFSFTLLYFVHIFSITKINSTNQYINQPQKIDTATLIDPQFNSGLVLVGNNFLSTNQTKLASFRKELEIETAITKVKNFFQRYGAKMSGNEEHLVRKSFECGGDYRIIVGIAGNESGLGRIPLGGHNPFGYMDGRYYNDWGEAIDRIVCIISQRFIIPCNGDLNCIIKKYGGKDTPKEQWIRNVTWFMNQV